ncbi:hypothetical protein CVT25_007159 [Psilocybe cyanescens]|uniref:Uncharacterized protein n=1 Tax=Psilocybe cyanescens TaxID=93625 RepID=A0A409WVQ6_PSICY|nr:hypothetical protein CVT25_007159 [Psilocybe cyanescens]
MKYTTTELLSTSVLDPKLKRQLRLTIFFSNITIIGILEKTPVGSPHVPMNSVAPTIIQEAIWKATPPSIQRAEEMAGSGGPDEAPSDWDGSEGDPGAGYCKAYYLKST